MRFAQTRYPAAMSAAAESQDNSLARKRRNPRETTGSGRRASTSPRARTTSGGFQVYPVRFRAKRFAIRRFPCSSRAFPCNAVRSDALPSGNVGGGRVSRQQPCTETPEPTGNNGIGSSRGPHPVVSNFIPCVSAQSGSLSGGFHVYPVRFRAKRFAQTRYPAAMSAAAEAQGNGLARKRRNPRETTGSGRRAATSPRSRTTSGGFHVYPVRFRAMRFAIRRFPCSARAFPCKAVRPDAGPDGKL